MSDAPESKDQDIDLLLAMARDKTAAGRKSLVETVSNLFFNRGGALTDRERTLMSDILRSIIHEVEMSVRQDLAQRLAKADNVPHDLILALANDDIQVAHPILINTKILHDADLVEIIHHRTLQHQLAIAARRNLSEIVSDALVETGNGDVIKTLLENPDARISKSTMEYLVEQAKHVDTYQNPLLHRYDLDPDLAKRMYWWVSAALRKHIVEHFDVDPSEIEASIETSVHSLMAEEKAGVALASKPIELAAQLDADGKFTTDMMVQALRQGEVPLFEAMFARRSGLRLRLLRRILFEPGGEALAVVCRAIDIPKTDFATIYMLTRKARGRAEPINPRELTRVLTLYDRLREDAVRAMLSRWQRDAAFLDAMRLLEGDGAGTDTDGDRGGPGDRRAAPRR